MLRTWDVVLAKTGTGGGKGGFQFFPSCEHAALGRSPRAQAAGDWPRGKIRLAFLPRRPLDGAGDVHLPLKGRPPEGQRRARIGGDLAGRSRVLLSVIDRIRSELPDLAIGVRLSVFDTTPYATSREVGRPMDYSECLPYRYGFGVDEGHPLRYDLAEPIELMRTLVAHGVGMLNLSCGSPYYVPHIQRPAIFPPARY